MIDLGSTDFYFGVPSLPREQLEKFSSRLFDKWESRVSQEVPLDDYALTLQIEEGSIKGAAKVRAALVALGLFVSNYGSVVQGLQTMRSHIALAGDYLTDKAHELLGPEKPAPIVHKRAGTLGQIQRLFIRVQRREITAEEATLEAERILGEEAVTAPDFMYRLGESFRRAPWQSQQLFLSPAGELCEPASEQPTKTPMRRPPSPRSALPPLNQYRVEIWRDSKRGKKHIRIVPV